MNYKIIILIVSLCLIGFVGLYFGIKEHNTEPSVVSNFKKYRCDANFGCVEDPKSELSKEECDVECSWYALDDKSCKASITPIGSRIPSISKDECMDRFNLYSCSGNQQGCELDRKCLDDDGITCFSSKTECDKRTVCKKQPQVNYYKCNTDGNCVVNPDCDPNTTPDTCFTNDQCNTKCQPQVKYYKCNADGNCVVNPDCDPNRTPDTCFTNDQCKTKCQPQVKYYKCDKDGNCMVNPGCTEKSDICLESCPEKCPTYSCKDNSCQLTDCDTNSENCYYDKLCEQKCSAVVDKSWDGWATTTYFGDIGYFPDNAKEKSVWNGDEKHPDQLYRLQNFKTGKILYDGKLRDVRIYAAAIPWGFMAKTGYTNIQNYYDDIIWSSRGEPDRYISKPPCFLVQQIRVFPDQIKGNENDVSSAQYNCSSSENCYDINSDDIATDDNGNEFPLILIIPFQGCGGDCAPSLPDCFNSVNNVGQLRADFNAPITDERASGIVAQRKNNWTWTKETEKEYLGITEDQLNNVIKDPSITKNFKNSDIAISERTKYGRERGKWYQTLVNNIGPGARINHCTTNHLNFDLALKYGMSDYVPFDKNYPTPDFAKDGNVLVRYKRIECNLIGNLVGDYNLCNVDGILPSESNPDCTVENVCKAKKGEDPCKTSGGGGSGGGSKSKIGETCLPGNCETGVCISLDCKSKNNQYPALDSDPCYTENRGWKCRPDQNTCNNLPKGDVCIPY